VARKSNRGGRDVSNPIASGTLPRYTIRPLRPLASIVVTLPPNLTELEDRRTYRPDRSVRAPAAVQRKDTRLNTFPSPARLAAYGFQNPHNVALCVRRKVRKEVIHAIRVAGKTGLKRPKRNFWSNVKC
jgi:hypothetical protein